MPSFIPSRRHLLRVRAQAPDRKPRTRERMPLEELRRQPELTSDLANLILVKIRQRFDNAALLDQSLNTRHAVVMRLDQIRLGRPAGFDRVGINRTLPQNPFALQE